MIPFIFLSDGVDFHLPTYVTCLQPLAGVNSHMVFQLLLLGEHNLEEMNVASTFDICLMILMFDRYLTNRTSCPLLPSVGPLVAVARPLVTEGHLAELALVRLDPEVDSNVSLQVALLHKLLGAVRTLVPWTNVDQHVLVKAVPPVKLFSTIVALVLLLAFVAHPMVVKAGFGDKSQTAERTNIGVGIWVIDLVVKTPCIRSFQNLIAHLANEALLSLVRVAGRKVGLQRLSTGKFLLAHVASVADPLLVGLPVLPDVRLQGLPVFQLRRAMGTLEADSLGMFSPNMARQELALWEE